jgi:beta-ribofuranosylaminobenzene 5'-phosphate synthase
MTDFELFEPGSNLILSGDQRTGILQRSNVNIRVPGRIHISPIDCNRFAFGKPGGGGLGFALALDNTFSGSVTAQDEIEALESHRPLIAHWVALMKKLLMYDGGIKLISHISPHMRQHSGLGSSITLAAACTQAINLMFGEPFSLQELRRIIAYNFVESCQGKLVRGLETGVGSQVVLQGGFCIIGDKTVCLYSSHLLDTLPVLLIFPNVKRPNMDQPESLEMLSRSLDLDASYRYIRAYRAIMDIAPAVEERNLSTIGQVIWDFQFSGTHQSMIQAYEDGGVRIIEIMTRIKKAGANIVGMSSVGSTVYAVSEDVNSLIMEAERISEPYLSTQIDSQGITVMNSQRA